MALSAPRRAPRGASRGGRAEWHTGALYDAIWEFDLPPIVLREGKRAGRVDMHGKPVVEVSETAQRVVLMAMAKQTNPTRDRGRYRCCPTVERIAMLTGLIDRQVQLVLKTHKDSRTSPKRAGRARRPQSSRSAELVGATPRALAEEIAEWSRSRLRHQRRSGDGREAGHATNGGWSRSRPPENADGGEAGFTPPGTPEPGTPPQ